MKKFCLLFIFALSCNAFSQKSIEETEQEISALKDKQHFAVSYDKFKDETTLTMRANLYKKNAQLQKDNRIFSLEWLIITVFSGEGINETKSRILCSHTSSPDWLFLRNRTIRLLAGNDRITSGEGLRRGTFGKYRGVDESVCWDFSENDFNRILNADALEFQQGVIEGKVRADKMPLFADYLKLSEK